MKFIKKVAPAGDNDKAALKPKSVDGGPALDGGKRTGSGCIPVAGD